MVDLLVKVPCSDMHKSFTPNAISGTPLTLFRCDRRHATMHVNIFIHVHVKPERAMVSIFFFLGPKLGDPSEPVSATLVRWIGKVWVSRWWWYRLYTDGYM
jgi:hypothetical protein